MATRGRKKKADSLSRGAPDRPDWVALSAEASGHWDHLCGLLRAAETDSPIYGEQLAAAVRHWMDRARYASEAERDGRYQVSAAGRIYMHPALRAAEDSQRSYERCLAELGLTPASRKRVKKSPTQAPPADPMAALIKLRTRA